MWHKYFYGALCMVLRLLWVRFCTIFRRYYFQGHSEWQYYIHRAQCVVRLYSGTYYVTLYSGCIVCDAVILRRTVYGIIFFRGSSLWQYIIQGAQCAV